jgi:DNA-binding transcriptional MerR regulator
MEGSRLNYYFTGILIVLFVLLAFMKPAYPGSTQTNTSGSNTAIEGGYTSTATTTYQTGSSSNSTTTNNSTSNTKSAPPSASSPSYNSMTQDVCAVGGSLGVQTFGLGVSGGKHFVDKNCERLKLARILNDFGMKVAAVAILCQDERVFESMIQAGTPCPIDGKIGKEAKQLWSKYDHERPDYKTYVKRMDDRKKADIAEQKRITKELEEMDRLQAIEDKKQAIEDKKLENAKKMKDWKHPK